ncbi:N-acetyltransferase family protein [Pseudoduganella sp.]|uniref:GNAT family N-acetyltransferase n=1 Tax=Pseudoduganella sp. TaxID=1880898 RepID=UPI0035B3372E
MSTVTIRKAGSADAAAFLTLIRELAAYEGFEAYVRTTEQSLLRDSEHFGVFLVEAEGRAAGYLSYTIGYSIWGAGHYMHVDDVYVGAALRGTGVGKLLMKAAAEECLARGYVFARWGVESSNAAARGFYRNIGAEYKEKGLCTWSREAMAAFAEG